VETANRLIVVGLNHETAPVPVRERVAFSSAQLRESLQALSDYAAQGIIVSTCNRTEVYTVANGRSSAGRLLEFLSAHSGIRVEDLEPHLYTLEEQEVVRHLFRVSSGLESMVVGEHEVLGQVRQALEQATAARLVSQPLAGLFQQAVSVGRRVREETEISKNAASVSSAAVALAKTVFDDLERRQVLVIGAGEAGALVAKALVKIGACQVMVRNRSFEKAEALASEIGAMAVASDGLAEALLRADIVISCSGAPHFIIKPESMREAVEARTSHPILLIDIAVPRDIDPAVRGIEGVILHDIDDLSLVVTGNREVREREAGKAEDIIEAEVQRFVEWRESRNKAPVIKALVDKAERIRSAQLARALKGMPDVTPEDEERLEAMTRAIVKKILHGPISTLKNRNGHNVEAVRELFELETRHPPDDSP
jgi:glutamyl-tRNA reductase